MCLHVQLQNDSVIIHEKDSYLYVKQSDLETDCILYRQVHNCARGCLSASRIGNQSQCSEDCMSHCESNAYQGHDGVCTGGCNTSQCNHGCSAYKTMRDGENSFLVPNKPSLPLEMLEDSSSATVGMYVVNVANADWSKDPTLGSDQESGFFGPETQTDVESAQFFVTFVIQVVEQEQVDVVYVVEAGLPQNVSLNFFSCEDVAVSYALVDKHGPSTFSEPAPIQTVKGVELSQPNGVSNLMADWYYDARPGFFGHFCMNFSWLNPTDLNSVKLYEIAYDTQNHNICGLTEEKIISPSPDQRSTGYTFICATNPESAFIAKCTYYLYMTTIPILDCAENITSSFISLAVPSYQPQLNPKCARRLNQTDNLFVIDLTIELSSYLTGEQVIYAFDLLLTRIQYVSKEESDEDTLKSPYKKKMPANESVFTESFYGLEPRAETNIEYSVGVSVDWKSIFEPNVETFYCSVSAFSERPDIITHVTLNKLTILQDNLKFKVVVSWDKPGSFNGVFTKYEVAIAGTALAPDANEVLSGTLTVEITSVNETRLDMEFLYHPFTFCYYLQVRSSNKYLASNWSEPLVLPVNSQCPGYMYPSSTPTSELQSVPTVSMHIASSSPLTSPTSSSPLTSPTSSLPLTSPTSSSPLTSPTLSILTPGPQPLSSTVYISVAGVILVILPMACVVTLLCCHWIMRRRKRRLELIQEDFDPMFRSGPRQSVYAMENMLPFTDEWEIPAVQIIIENCLGQGAFGEVYKGLIIEPITNPRIKNLLQQSGSSAIAVKLLKPSAAGTERNDFLKEIDMMKKIAEGNNPHVVNMVGCVTIQEPLCLITEFVKYGDLLSYLRTTRKQAAEKHMSDPKGIAEASAYFEDPYPELSELEPVDLISFAYQIASGMEFLTSLGIVHRDLACRNILIGEGKSLKISDFGMSREVGTGADDAYVKTTKGRLPLKWMAIESIVDREFTAASDVWSYGVLLWEIGTLGGFPYPTIQNEDLLTCLRRGYRMEKPENCSPEIYEIMLECWHDCPRKRPGFTELRAKFDSLLAAQQCNIYIDLQTDEQQDIYKTDLANEGDSRHSSGSTTSSVFEHSPALSRKSVASGKSVENGYLTVTNAWEQQSCNELDGLTLSPVLQTTRQGSPRMSPSTSPHPSPNTSSGTRPHRPLSLALWETESRKENPYVDDPFERSNAAGIVIQVSSSSPSSPTTTPRRSQITVGVRNPLFI